MRPGKRGGWVAGDLSWGNVHMLAPPRLSRRSSEVAARALCDLPSVELEFDWLITAIRTELSHGDAKTISLLRFESPQLWPLLDEARRVGLRSCSARHGGYASAHRRRSCAWTSRSAKGAIFTVQAGLSGGTTAGAAVGAHRVVGAERRGVRRRWVRLRPDSDQPTLRRCSA